MKQATRETAEKIIDLLSHGLSCGLGEPEPGKMCVEAAVCYAMGLPHSDEPVCVSPAIREFKIRLNDAEWSSLKARAEGMKRLAIAQLNSVDTIDNREFANRLINLTIRKIVPAALRNAAIVHPDKNHKASLEAAATTCEVMETINSTDAASVAYAFNTADRATKIAAKVVEAAYAFNTEDRAAKVAANVAKVAYAADRAISAVTYTVYATNESNLATNVAANASTSAVYAADSAASAASVANAINEAKLSATSALARDNFLSSIAEDVVQILIDMKAPGTAWLDLVPLKGEMIKTNGGK